MSSDGVQLIVKRRSKLLLASTVSIYSNTSGRTSAEVRISIPTDVDVYV